jgi:hypothetical protein
LERSWQAKADRGLAIAKCLEVGVTANEKEPPTEGVGGSLIIFKTRGSGYGLSDPLPQKESRLLGWEAALVDVVGSAVRVPEEVRL